VKSLVIVMTVVALLVAAVAIGALILDPISPIEACLDHGERWSYSLGQCECTPEELASPTVTKALVEHCDKPSPAPER
jgi:hypothetical protein